MIVGEEENIKVAVRIRPLQQGEASKGETSCVRVGGDGREVQVRMGPLDAHVYSCNRCFAPETSQQTFFNDCGLKDLLDSAIGGYRACAFAFGQTGAGKTYCIVGPGSAPRPGEPNDGIIGRSLEYLFNKLNSLNVKYTLRLSCLEIYHEQVYDLFSDAPLERGERPSLAVREHATDGFFLEGCRMLTCSSAKTACAALDIALRHRQVGEHDLNSRSNRSHVMTDVFIELPGQAAMRSMQEGQEHEGQYPGLKGLGEAMAADQEYTVMGRITLVDLAGSENMKKTNSTGKAVQEAGFINKSLYTLGKVISGLTKHTGEGGAKHRDVPFRDSKLTKLLISSLGGRSRTLLMACVTEASGSHAETMRTLKFSVSCARIKNRPVRFLDPQKKLIMELQGEIRRLRNENEQLRSNLLTAPTPHRSPLRGGREDDSIGDLSERSRRAASASPVRGNNRTSGGLTKAKGRGVSKSPERRPQPKQLPGLPISLKSKSEQVLRNAGIFPTQFKARQLDMIMNRRAGPVNSRIRGSALKPIRDGREVREVRDRSQDAEKIRELESRIARVEKRALSLLGSASSGVLDIGNDDDDDDIEERHKPGARHNPTAASPDGSDDDSINSKIKPSLPKFKVIKELGLEDLLPNSRVVKRQGKKTKKTTKKRTERPKLDPKSPPWGDDEASQKRGGRPQNGVQSSPSIAGRLFEPQWRKEERRDVKRERGREGKEAPGKEARGRSESRDKRKEGPSPYIYHLVGQPPGPRKDRDRERERDKSMLPAKPDPQKRTKKSTGSNSTSSYQTAAEIYDENLAEKEELRLLKEKMSSKLTVTHSSTTSTSDAYARVKDELSTPAKTSPHTNAPAKTAPASSPAVPSSKPAAPEDDDDAEGEGEGEADEYGEDFEDDFEEYEEDEGEETERDRAIKSQFGAEVAVGSAVKAAHSEHSSPAAQDMPAQVAASPTSPAPAPAPVTIPSPSSYAYKSPYARQPEPETEHEPEPEPEPSVHTAASTSPAKSASPYKAEPYKAGGASPTSHSSYQPSSYEPTTYKKTETSTTNSSSSSSSYAPYQPSTYKSEPADTSTGTSSYQPSSYQPSSYEPSAASQKGGTDTGAYQPSTYKAAPAPAHVAGAAAAASSYTPSAPRDSPSSSGGYEPSFKHSEREQAAPAPAASTTSGYQPSSYQPSSYPNSSNANNASSSSSSYEPTSSSTAIYKKSTYESTAHTSSYSAYRSQAATATDTSATEEDDDGWGGAKAARGSGSGSGIGSGSGSGSARNDASTSSWGAANTANKSSDNKWGAGSGGDKKWNSGNSDRDSAPFKATSSSAHSHAKNNDEDDDYGMYSDLEETELPLDTPLPRTNGSSKAAPAPAPASAPSSSHRHADEEEDDYGGDEFDDYEEL